MFDTLRRKVGLMLQNMFQKIPFLVISGNFDDLIQNGFWIFSGGYKVVSEWLLTKFLRTPFFMEHLRWLLLKGWSSQKKNAFKCKISSTVRNAKLNVNSVNSHYLLAL